MDRHPDAQDAAQLAAPGVLAPRPIGGTLRRRPPLFEITTDGAFEEVITACGQPRWYEAESWIDERIIGLYCLLHERRIALQFGLETEPRGFTVGGSYSLPIP